MTEQPNKCLNTRHWKQRMDRSTGYDVLKHEYDANTGCVYEEDVQCIKPGDRWTCGNEKHYPRELGRIHQVDEITPCRPPIEDSNTDGDINFSDEGSEGQSSYRVPIKFRFDLIPPIALQQLAEVFEEGAVKYGPQKYTEKPLPYSVILNHVYNHLNLLQSGDRSELHAAKVMWGMCAIIVLDSLEREGFLPDQNDVSKWGLQVIPSPLEEEDGQ